MSWGNRRWNSYHKRYYTISDSKARKYAQAMEELETTFQNDYPDWDLSDRKDSCYHWVSDDIQLRISNHSANNQYHNLDGDYFLLVNIKGSKLDFPKIIEERVPHVIEFLQMLDVGKYRFINIIGDKVNAFYKGYKTKKDVFELA